MNEVLIKYIVNFRGIFHLLEFNIGEFENFIKKGDIHE